MRVSLLLAWFLAAPATAQPFAGSGAIIPKPIEEVDIAQLVRELQWTAPAPADLSMVWLVPPTLMRALLIQSGSATPDLAQDAIRIFDPYLVIGVIRARLNAAGDPMFEPEGVVRSSVRVWDDSGRSYTPLAPADSIVANALSDMQRTLGRAVGDLGAHTTFLLFPAADRDGQWLFPMNRRTRFHVDLDALGSLPPQRISWRLPLASVLEDRVCPTCGDPFNGAWRYCPWDASALVLPEVSPAPAQPVGPVANP